MKVTTLSGDNILLKKKKLRYIDMKSSRCGTLKVLLLKLVLEIRQKYLYIKKDKKMDLAMKKCAGQGDGTFAIFPIFNHGLGLC